MTERRSRQRRDSTERRRETLSEHFGSISPKDIESSLSATPSDARIEIRCAVDTKSQIEAMAGRYGLTTTTYLLRLHELAASKLKL